MKTLLIMAIGVWVSLISLPAASNEPETLLTVKCFESYSANNFRHVKNNEYEYLQNGVIMFLTQEGKRVMASLHNCVVMEE